MYSNQIDAMVSQRDVIKSHHYVWDDLVKSLEGKSSDAQQIFFFSFIGVISFAFIVAISKQMSWLCKRCRGISRYFKTELHIAEMSMPNFYQMLRLQDLEEMIEEEYELSSEFNTNNMTRLAILKAESIY